jgi:hypothetical protein
MLMKNINMRLDIFINVHLLVYHPGIKHSLMHGHGTRKHYTSYKFSCEFTST